jgi:hypothetical protein
MNKEDINDVMQYSDSDNAAIILQLRKKNKSLSQDVRMLINIGEEAAAEIAELRISHRRLFKAHKDIVALPDSSTRYAQDYAFISQEALRDIS